MISKKNILFALALVTLVSCNKEIGPDGVVDGQTVIKVGGLLTDQMTVTVDAATKAADPVRAETLPWLQGALIDGLEIKYSNMTAGGSHVLDNESIAILKWTGTETGSPARGVYTFQYKGVSPAEDAHWYDNGAHYFEGQYVPDAIRDYAGHEIPANPSWTTDQHDATDDAEHHIFGNYSLLSHYISMPPSWSTSATVDQILLPFKHRLSRVIAYVLIDPSLKSDLMGYTYPDNPQNTEFKFDKVDVLSKVQETVSGPNTLLIPEWKDDARNVIPHFVDEYHQCLKDNGSLAYTGSNSRAITEASSSFIVYKRLSDNALFYPRDDKWPAVHQEYCQGVDDGKEAKMQSLYEKKVYLKVPVYDVIVRPTYTKPENVMYDEKGYYNNDGTINVAKRDELLALKNSIDFELTLASGLRYTKHFEFDLDANMQTIVYLFVDQEDVDYDESESQTWSQTDRNDGYYGVNNQLGHNMSIVGSSWQRALTLGSAPVTNITDGNNYSDDLTDPDKQGQYMSSEAKWIAEFKKATATGDRHGDYFILEKDITIDASELSDFVFTGHLDARGHTITITGGSYFLKGLNGVYTTNQENGTTPWQANVHKEWFGTTPYWVPVLGYRAELMNINLEGGTFFPSDATYTNATTDMSTTAATVSGYVYNCWTGGYLTGTPVGNVVPAPKYD